MTLMTLISQATQNHDDRSVLSYFLAGQVWSVWCEECGVKSVV
jgi:hypothetical protein